MTTICWVATAWLGPETDRRVLISFYEKVRPAGPGWTSIRAAANVSGRAPAENIPLALLGWVAGCTAIWSSLFTVGNFLYQRPGTATLLLVVFIASGLTLLFVVRKLWADSAGSAPA